MDSATIAGCLPPQMMTLSKSNLSLIELEVVGLVDESQEVKDHEHLGLRARVLTAWVPLSSAFLKEIDWSVIIIRAFLFFFSSVGSFEDSGALEVEAPFMIGLDTPFSIEDLDFVFFFGSEDEVIASISSAHLLS
nr:hypothetical protein Iba_chr10fCG7170 [Ipomoea batatas]